MRATTTTTTRPSSSVVSARRTTRPTPTGAQRSCSVSRGGGFVAVGLGETRMIRTAATRTMRRFASTSSSRTAVVTANAMPPSGRGEGAAGTRAVGVSQQQNQNQSQNQNQNNQQYAGSRGNPVRGTPPLPPPGRPTTTTTQGQGYQTPVPNGRAGGGIGAVIPEEIDAVYHQMQHLGTKWADAHAEAEMLEEAKKCVLATITLHFIADGGTKAAAEVQAYASQEYQDHVKKMVEARRKANLAKIELESVKTHLNLTRTYEASRREEMKLL